MHGERDEKVELILSNISSGTDGEEVVLAFVGYLPFGAVTIWIFCYSFNDRPASAGWNFCH